MNEGWTALKDWRVGSGMTMRELGKISGVPYSYICQIERRYYHPRLSLNVARRLARALGTTVDDLFPEQEEHEQATTEQEGTQPSDRRTADQA